MLATAVEGGRGILPDAILPEIRMFSRPAVTLKELPEPL
jgi:hypothetical protein